MSSLTRALNRAITFRHHAPLLPFLTPRFGVAVTPAILPVFVGAGAGAAMVLTFLGFRFFAFRP
ncbi:MAG TPA: hypothetical protein VKG91_10125 [Roseiarcus sp.]|nr:hypothetical protein [Roseiarcus sp.]